MQRLSITWDTSSLASFPWQLYRHVFLLLLFFSHFRIFLLLKPKFTSFYFYKYGVFALKVLKELIFWWMFSRPHRNKRISDCVKRAVMLAADVDLNKCLLCNVDEPKVKQKLVTEECIVRSVFCSRTVDILSLPFKHLVYPSYILLLFPSFFVCLWLFCMYATGGDSETRRLQPQESTFGVGVTRIWVFDLIFQPWGFKSFSICVIIDAKSHEWSLKDLVSTHHKMSLPLIFWTEMKWRRYQPSSW